MCSPGGTCDAISGGTAIRPFGVSSHLKSAVFISVSTLPLSSYAHAGLAASALDDGKRSLTVAARIGARRPHHSLHLHHEDALVVEGHGGELVQLFEDLQNQAVSRGIAVRPYHLREACAAEFRARRVEVIGDAVGVENNGVAGLGLERHFLILDRKST